MRDPAETLHVTSAVREREETCPFPPTPLQGALVSADRYHCCHGRAIRRHMRSAKGMPGQDPREFCPQMRWSKTQGGAVLRRRYCGG